MLESVDDSKKQERGVMCCSRRILPLQEVQGIAVEVLKVRVARLKIGDPGSKNCLARRRSYVSVCTQAGRSIISAVRQEPVVRSEQPSREGKSELTHSLITYLGCLSEYLYEIPYTTKFRFSGGVVML